MAKGASTDRWNGGDSVKASSAVAGQMKSCLKVMPAVSCQRFSSEFISVGKCPGFVPESCDDPVELQRATAGREMQYGKHFFGEWPECPKLDRRNGKPKATCSERNCQLTQAYEPV